MTTKRLSLFLSIWFLSPCAFPQGFLTPPAGPPAPTMKTLDQIDAKLEKRIPIDSLPLFIHASGSHYFTRNLSGSRGISVQASEVTIDLNGFTLKGTGIPAPTESTWQIRRRKSVSAMALSPVGIRGSRRSPGKFASFSSCRFRANASGACGRSGP